MFDRAPPAWALRRPKPLWQHGWDLLGAPLRMIALPDVRNEQLHLTSLRAERLAVVLPKIEGRLLDVGAGDNMLVSLYRRKAEGSPAQSAADDSVGLDVVDWGGGCVIVPDCRNLPFPDQSFDTVSFVACLNHIPERKEALQEALRVLRPGGLLVITMISRLIGDIGHAIWWYSEDKHRDVADGEVMGMNAGDVANAVKAAGFEKMKRTGFVYNLNNLFAARRPESPA
ncbi:MAG: methyltransferase domain-containing protein [Rhizobiales bacterium]|nr:methyltransferase domain-containing protein [Hyphomicrobiales bacterium]